MIEIKNKEILIDGKPQIIMCGEIHYYRLNRKEWLDRIIKLKDSGCNAVASYVPWLCHETIEGEFDLTGHTRPELDLASFIDICNENGLYFFLRPGPFIMAEMKNEGVPFWLYENYPEIIPVGWDGNPPTTKTLDYLAPSFLTAARKWYAALAHVVVPRLHDNGGNIIGIQLDNEIGMLSWVSNCPDLTENVLSDFASWLKNNYDSESLGLRYPFDLDNCEIRIEAIRSPKENYAAELMRDLGYYMRNRFARYVALLRSFAEEVGIKDIPFVINIHGTSGGRGFTFPVGISQLYDAYTQAPGYMSGSDIYLGDLTVNNFQDLYIINALIDSVNTADQPLSSVEFECGDGNYGSTCGGRFDPSAADFKTRMCIAQGNRMINYYLFAGGINYRLDQDLKDGDDRIAFTGERHGFAAPIDPEGELNYTYPRMSRSIKTMMAVSDKISVMQEEHDAVAFAFIPDYYMTEACYPKSEKMSEILKNIEKNRSYGAWEIMARAMLLSGYRFPAIDIQKKPINEWKVPVLALPSALYMHVALQEKLVAYLNSGGGILLYGEVPIFDMEGNPCTILADALKVKPIKSFSREQFLYISLYADGWAAPRPEVSTGFAQVFECTDAQPLLRVYGTDQVCGFDVKVGKGRAIVIAAAYSCDIPLFKTALEKLGAKAALTHDCKYKGIFMTSTASNDGERFLHILNLDGFDKEMHLYENKNALLDGRKILLQSKDGVMLPINVCFDDVKIVYSTAEIIKMEKNTIEFRLTQKKDVIAIETTREILQSDDYIIEKEGNKSLIISCKHAKVDNSLIVNFL